MPATLARIQIEQTAEGWNLYVGDDDPILFTGPNAHAGAMHAMVDAATAAAMPAMDGEEDQAEDMPATQEEALLPERWKSGPNGAVMQAVTGPERDFTGCAFTWRDTPLPLMLKTTSSHGGFEDGCAELAGFIDSVVGRQDGGVDMSGRFFNNDAGEEARAILIGQGQFGCSVDPSEYVDATFECTEMDDDGWCTAGVVRFTAYEIAGLTLVPFPGFEGCWIELDTPITASGDLADKVNTPDTADAIVEAITDTITAAAGAVIVDVPATPPARWFQLTEPQDPTDDTLGASLVAQADSQWGVPLTITDDGQVFGHLALWGTCHTAFGDVCVTPPASESGYAHFHLSETVCDDGTRVAVGNLVIGTDHAAAQLLAPEATDHYANTGMAVAQIRVVNGVHGPWACGALLPGFSNDQLRAIRASVPSGDWRRRSGNLELIAALLVSVPGFPVAREVIMASALEIPAAPHLTARTEAGVMMALTAAGIVRRSPADLSVMETAGTVTPCTDCGKRPARSVTASAPSFDGQVILDRLDQIAAQLGVIDRRTRPLIDVAAARQIARLGVGSMTVKDPVGVLMNGTPAASA